MRQPVDEARIRELAGRLNRATQDRTRIYVTGGATAVIEGWRASTVDVDMMIEPESDRLMREIGPVKNELQISIEFATPLDFIPELPGWRDRSLFAFTIGKIDVYHFDPYSQALSKIERGFDQDLSDAKSMVDNGFVDAARLKDLFESVTTELYRFPALDEDSFRARLEEFIVSLET